MANTPIPNSYRGFNQSRCKATFLSITQGFPSLDADEFEDT